MGLRLEHRHTSVTWTCADRHGATGAAQAHRATGRRDASWPYHGSGLIRTSEPGTRDRTREPFSGPTTQGVILESFQSRKGVHCFKNKKTSRAHIIPPPTKAELTFRARKARDERMRDVREGPSSPTTDEESHGRGMRDTEERDTRLAKRQCLAAPSISPSPSISPPPPHSFHGNCPLTVISGDRQTFYADRPMICAASTFIRNTLADTLCEVLNLPPWLQASAVNPDPDPI